MSINIARAAATRTVDGRRYVLCSDLCRDRFDADPNRYAANEARP